MSTTPPTSPPRALAAVRHLDTSASKRKRPHEEMSESPKLSQEGKEEALRFGDTFSVQPQTGETHDNPPLESDKSQELGGAGITEDGPNKKETPDEKLTDEAFDPKQNIPDFDWEEFESRYLTAMAEEDNLQSAIHEEFRTRMNFFGIWAQSAVVHENERAQKRIKTRMHYVKGAEQNLIEKRDHYLKVVKAFETALALLSGP